MLHGSNKRLVVESKMCKTKINTNTNINTKTKAKTKVKTKAKTNMKGFLTRRSKR